uniref:PROX-1 n=1 Tax=Schmidtea mediterranea TaxID=79327 RepID=H9CXU6_SCHMD|nr:PROX-1 [Schmidtea mediterranea]
MIKSAGIATSSMCCKVQNPKMNSPQPYSVQSLLNQEGDDSILDLSVKEKRLRQTHEEPVSNEMMNLSEVLPELSNPDRMKQILFNVIQQRELHAQSNKKLNNQNVDFFQTSQSNLDNLQKFCNPSQNLPWNFLRPPVSSVSDTGASMLNQFQKFLFNKNFHNQTITNPNSIYPRRNMKNLFPNSFNPDSIPHYFNNLTQLFHSRLNQNNQTETTSHIPVVLPENFSKQYTNSNIDINTHFSLQNILKSSSNRKRKRTKVTDTRLPRRNTSLGNFPNLHESTIPETTRFSNYLNPPSNSSQSSHSEETPGDPKRYTLTPIHLRKAKLMFLYTRYPNSQMLKSYFPDITFYKQNTAQLVKWFSNFREFYYNEMEKAVQRAVSNGIQQAKDIDVTVESELFKNLMTHFNKKKQIVVPCEFLTTVQITLREFFEAISAGKNLHQSWKKPIYKTIAKLDQMLPEFFKDMNWMMELAKDENDSLNS